MNRGACNWEGVARLCDMGIGHCLKELAKNGIAAQQIVATLTKEGLLPRNPYTRTEIYVLGKIFPVRFRQDGNLWEALGEIGEPAMQALRDATKDTDQDITQEAAKVLKSIGEQN